MRASVEPIDDVHSFIDDWREFGPAPTVFTTAEWIGALLETWPAQSTPYAVRVMTGDRDALIGLAGRPRQLPPASLREMRLTETGDPDTDRIYIEFNDFRVAGPDAMALRRAAVGALIDAFSVDQVVFRNARPALVEAVRAVASERRLAVEAMPENPTFEVALDAGVSHSKSMRAMLARTESAYAARGVISIERGGDEHARQSLWTILQSLHGARWRKRGEKGVFANARLIAFHEALMRRAPHAIDLFGVRAGDHYVGVLYNFIHDGVASNYQSGIALEDDARLAPGFLCHALACRRYAEEGLSAYSFLAGDADYKRRLGKQGETLQTVAIVLKTWRQGVRALVRRARAVRSAGTHRT